MSFVISMSIRSLSSIDLADQASKDFNLALIRLMLELIPTVCNSTRELVS